MEQNLFLTKENGLKISAILNKVNEDSKEVVIIAHGFASDKNGSSEKISKLLEAKGISAFRFDFFGHGESDGNFEDITVSEGVKDILTSIDYLVNQGFEKISLLGTSFGGACSVLAASQTNKIKKLGLRSPVGDFYIRDLITKSKKELTDWVENGFRYYSSTKRGELLVNSSFFLDSKTHHGYKAAENIQVPTLIVHGDQDENVPVLLSQMLEKVIKDCELKIIEGADHTYSEKMHNEMALDYLIEFLIN